MLPERDRAFSPSQSNVSGSVREHQAPLFTALGSTFPAGHRESTNAVQNALVARSFAPALANAAQARGALDERRRSRRRGGRNESGSGDRCPRPLLNAEEALAATSVAGLEGLLPHGILERRAERTLAVLATGAGSGQRGVTLELRRASEADAVAVAGRREARLVGARRRMAPRVGLEPTTTR